ncbi:uncharacterized protein [Eurosta solidaginis]|uniref:uncharacterized protein n=1 Tax=Eurosta solidaginis TaxID=178769 RepID=UPI0035306DF3
MVNASSSDSDDGNDEQIRQILEAADASLLTDAMYQKSAPDNCKNEKAKIDNILDVVGEQNVPRSNRYLLDFDMPDTDFITTEAVKKHIAKKLTLTIGNTIEFCAFDQPTVKHKTSRNRVKLLSDANTFVKPYEEFEFETKGPTKKPIIKRRKIDEQEEKGANEDLFHLVAVTAEDIMAGKLTVGWMPKTERKEKNLHYKCNSVGKLHLKPTENEFTKLRLKNKWNESKIKQKKWFTST